jgi:hypothetical protein
MKLRCGLPQMTTDMSEISNIKRCSELFDPKWSCEPYSRKLAEFGASGLILHQSLNDDSSHVPAVIVSRPASTHPI